MAAASAAAIVQPGEDDVMPTVVITGGSRGIGAAAVELFARRGDRVYFLYEKNHEAANAVARKTGATAIACDVADATAVAEAFRRIPDVDVLICNAGICQYGLMSQTDEASWDRLFAVNVKGIYHCVNAAMPSFLRKQKGCVITVSSMWGQVGASCEAAYSATKGAVIALSKSLAKELGPSGIRVNVVAPGVILTDMCAQVDPEVLEEMAQEAPVGKNGTPEDVAHAMEYLADAEFVTGQALPVNGGYVI
jgi:3-oxoacyl-[acyl-carrier protein] reductase